jgi:hypothetical protein
MSAEVIQQSALKMEIVICPKRIQYGIKLHTATPLAQDPHYLEQPCARISFRIKRQQVQILNVPDFTV